VKKECDKLIAENKNSSTPGTIANGPSGQLRNLKKEMFEDAVSEDAGDVLPEPVSNDTNEEELYYFARLSKHYLRLVKASTPVAKPSRHIMKYPHPAAGHVLLGDGKTSLSIKGVGTVKYKIGSNILRIENVRYIPDLAESIYSLFLHI
jgi:hypothetical protein